MNGMNEDEKLDSIADSKKWNKKQRACIAHFPITVADSILFVDSANADSEGPIFFFSNFEACNSPEDSFSILIVTNSKMSKKMPKCVPKYIP